MQKIRPLSLVGSTPAEGGSANAPPVVEALEAEGKVVAISGDAVACDGLTRLARGADLLVAGSAVFWQDDPASAYRGLASAVGATVLG